MLCYGAEADEHMVANCSGVILTPNWLLSRTRQPDSISFFFSTSCMAIVGYASIHSIYLASFQCDGERVAVVTWPALCTTSYHTYPPTTLSFLVRLLHHAMRMRVITLPLLAKTVDPTHRATWRVHALASSWVFPNCIRRRSPSRLCVYWKWTNSKASCTPVDPYSLSLCHIV